MAAKLVAEEGSLKGLILLLDDGDQWVIGRDPDSCQLLVEDPIASRRHLICRSTPQGFEIQNLSKTNPVQINNEEVSEPKLLTDGDLVRIGGGVYRFYEDSEARLVHEETKEELPLKEDESPEEEIPEDEPDASEEESLQSEPDAGKEELSEDEPDVNEEEFLEDEPDASKGELSEKEPVVSTTEEANEAEHEEIFSEDDLDEEPDFNEAIQSRRDTIFDEDIDDEEALLADINFDMIEAGRWLLKVIAGPNTGAEFTMRAGARYIIGTDPRTCDIIFNDTSVSRKHASIQITDDDIITIEDLGSRNGTLVDGQRFEERHGLEPNIVVNLGTSAFVIFDKEGEMHTIISPLLPSIVKVLQQEDHSLDEEDVNEEGEELDEQNVTISPEEKEEIAVNEVAKKNNNTLTAFIMIAIITGMFVTMGIAMVTLFQSNPIEIHSPSDSKILLNEALAPFTGVEHTYNKATGNLMIVGHVLTDNAKRQLLYNLEGLDFIQNIDASGIVIDEKVWQDLNPKLSRNPSWKGVTLQANAPGQFNLTGYLKTRAQMESLVDYMNTNFPYLDNLRYRVVVEEELIAKARLDLVEAGFNNIKVSVNNGDVILQGAIPTNLHDSFEKVLANISNIPGVRNVQDYVTEVEQVRSTRDITDRYSVTGVSRIGGNVSVVIDGRILSKGDILDGMTITEISTKAVLLEENGVTYRIDLRPSS